MGAGGISERGPRLLIRPGVQPPARNQNLWVKFSSQTILKTPQMKLTQAWLEKQDPVPKTRTLPLSFLPCHPRVTINGTRSKEMKMELQ